MSLERWFNGSEPEKNWLEERKMSGEIINDLGAEGSIEQMVWDIDNARIREILMYNLNEKLRTREDIKKEIAVYYEKIEPRLWDESFNELFNMLISKKRIIPSHISEEFKCRDQIMAESDPKVKELMEISLANKRFPSMVLQWRNIYEELAKVENEDEKRIIKYYLKNGLSPRWVEDEYVFYTYIRDFEYKNEKLKSFLLSLINDNNVAPSLVVNYFDIFKNDTIFREAYIRSLINTWWL